MHKEAILLLEKEWLPEEKLVISRLANSLKYYKYMIPNALKQDILSSIQLCTKMKDALEAAANETREGIDASTNTTFETTRRRNSV